MMSKVLCPWCGSEMRLSYERYVRDVGGFYRYVCKNEKCFSASPINEDKEDAYAAALRRPLQKPLTLEEACGSNEPCVYLEMRNDRIGFRGYRAAYSGSHVAYVNLYERKENEIVYRALILDIGTLFFSGKDYGDKWRCWATNPTQEEREAAKWE